MKEWIIGTLLGLFTSGLVVMVLRGYMKKLGDMVENVIENNTTYHAIASTMDDIVDSGFAYLKTHYADRDWVKLVETADRLYDIFADEAGLRDDLEEIEAKMGKEKAVRELGRRIPLKTMWMLPNNFDGDQTIGDI